MAKKMFCSVPPARERMVADGCPQTALRLSGVNGMACRRHAVTQKENTPLGDCLPEGC